MFICNEHICKNKNCPKELKIKLLYMSMCKMEQMCKIFEKTNTNNYNSLPNRWFNIEVVDACQK